MINPRKSLRSAPIIELERDKMMHSQRWGMLFAMFLVLVCGGCTRSDGPKRGAVEATVKFEGEPVPEGTITFTPAEGTTGPIAGGPIADGEIHIPAVSGPVVGKQRVSIFGQRKTGKVIDALPPLKAMWEERVPYIPEKYNTKTDLIVEVKSGINKYEFDLKK